MQSLTIGSKAGKDLPKEEQERHLCTIHRLRHKKLPTQG
jgi:hypothetical protein